MTLSLNQLSTYHSLFAPYCIFLGSHVTLFWMDSLTHLPQCPHKTYHIHAHPPQKKTLLSALQVVMTFDLNKFKSRLHSYHPSMFVQYVMNLIMVSIFPSFIHPYTSLSKSHFTCQPYFACNPISFPQDSSTILNFLHQCVSNLEILDTTPKTFNLKHFSW